MNTLNSETRKADLSLEKLLYEIERAALLRSLIAYKVRVLA